MIVISDTTPLISLMKADCLDILQSIFGEVIIPEAVYDELTANTNYPREASMINGSRYISKESVINYQSVDELMGKTGLDIGESEAIVMVKEKNADLLLIDEHRGRQTAKEMGIAVVGTVGLLLRAYDQKLMNAPEVWNAVEIIIQNDIRISKSLLDIVKEHIGLMI